MCEGSSRARTGERWRRGVGAVKETYFACLLNLCLDSHPGDGERSADNGGIPTC